MSDDSGGLILVLIVSILLGLIPAFIAQNKGRNFVLWWIFGAAFFVIALIASLVIKRRDVPSATAY
jgi:hypothetical protein